MQFGASIREKPQWWIKVNDPAITAKWVAEAKAQSDAFNDKNLAYMIDELKWQASQRDIDGPIQVSVTDGVWQADGLVPEELKARLLAGVAKLEEIPEDKHDYHPGTNKQVVDLVHPSLYCLRIGHSKETKEPFGVADALTMFGAGEVKGKAPPPLIDPPTVAADGSASSSSASSAAAAAVVPAPGRRSASEPWANKRDYAESKHFAWLPAEFSVSDQGKVRIDSYINNLHPSPTHMDTHSADATQQRQRSVPPSLVLSSHMSLCARVCVRCSVEHAALYPVLEGVCELFLPMWERVLSALKNPPPQRVPVTSDWYEPPAEIAEAVKAARKAARAERKAKEKAEAKAAKEKAAAAGGAGAGAAAAAAEEEEEEEEDEDDDDDDDEEEDDDWYENRPIYMPNVEADFQAPPVVSAEKAVKLAGRKLQVIVKLANIELTPANPKYKGGSWHVEGMLNERIVASGIYYFHSDNITESRLAFRQACKEPVYVQGDDRGVEAVYGLTSEGSLSQDLGSLLTKADRMIAFPNVLQHQVQPFELEDASKPGSRKILVFFLCDPSAPVVSTATVPPQQLSWFHTAAYSTVRQAFREATPLIDDLTNICFEYLRGQITT